MWGSILGIVAVLLQLFLEYLKRKPVLTPSEQLEQRRLQLTAAKLHFRQLIKGGNGNEIRKELDRVTDLLDGYRVRSQSGTGTPS